MAELPEMTMEIGEIKPQRWEYLATWLVEDDLDLNELGKLGWELVLVVVLRNGESRRAYFKRPIWSD